MRTTPDEGSPSGVARSVRFECVEPVHSGATDDVDEGPQQGGEILDLPPAVPHHLENPEAAELSGSR